MQLQGIRLIDREPLRDYVVAQYARHSNRPNCKCNTKGQLHGPYYYRVWTDTRGKRHKEYIPRGQEREIVARVRQWHIDNNRHCDLRGRITLFLTNCLSDAESRASGPETSASGPDALHPCILSPNGTT